MVFSQSPNKPHNNIKRYCKDVILLQFFLLLICILQADFNSKDKTSHKITLKSAANDERLTI